VPLYFTRAITAADLQGRSLRELSLIRNTIFARAGNPFRKQWLSSYFRAQPWYAPAVKMDESRLTPLDRENANFVAAYEAALPRVDLVGRKAAVLARYPGKTGEALVEALSEPDRTELILLARALGESGADYFFADGDDPEFEISPLDDPRMLDRQIVAKDLADLSRRDLRILRNMVYARHGRPFQSLVLQQYFGNMEWYKPDPAYSDSRLSALDKRNVQVIRSVEDSIGGPMTEAEHSAEWFGGA
jgi:hypothetical protein